LTTLREKLIKIGAKVVNHGRYVMFQIAEVAVPRRMCRDILRLIARLRTPAGTSMTGEWGRMGQTEAEAVRLDERKTRGCKASVRSIGRFGRALRESPCCGSPKERP